MHDTIVLTKLNVIGVPASAVLIGTTANKGESISLLQVKIYTFANGVYIDVNVLLAFLGAIGVTYVITAAINKRFGKKDKD